jgi:hypothetical protein
MKVVVTCPRLFPLLFLYMVFRELGATFTPSIRSWDEHKRMEPEGV